MFDLSTQRLRHAMMAACVCVALPAYAGDDSEYVPEEPAIQSEMATETLLLDIARAGDRLVAVGEYGHVVYSDDGGDTWTQAEYVPTRRTLTAVDFADDMNGWAVGHDSIVIHTADGGVTWARQYIDLVTLEEGEVLTGDMAPPDNPLLAVSFFDSEHGMAVGAFSTVLETFDGGETWEDRDLNVPVDDSDPYYFPEEYHLNGVFSGPQDTIFVAAEFGTVYRSENGGDSFVEIATPYDGSFWGGITYEDSVLVFGMRGNVWRSDDLGETWYDVDSDTGQSLGGAAVLEDGTIVMAGLAGAVTYSTDGGQTFTSVTRPARLGLSSVAQATDNRVVIVGEAGVAFMPDRAENYSPDLF